MASLGAIGLFVGLAIPTVGVLAAAWMVAYFLVAALSHPVRADFNSFGVPLIFGLVFVGLVVLRWSDATPILTTLGLA